jgi:hypothetical protein
MSSALVLSRYFPFNATRRHAVYQRLGTQVQALARVFDRVDCLFLIPPEQQCGANELREHEEQLRALWTPALKLHLAAVVHEPASTSAWERVGRGVFDFRAHPIARAVSTDAARALLRSALIELRPALILAHRLSSMCLLMEVSGQVGGTPVVFDLDDVEHIAWFRRLLHDPGWGGERLLLLQTPRLMLAERSAARLARTTFVCSESDRRSLKRLSGDACIEVIPNSVPFPSIAAAGVKSEALALFIGSMGSRPNAQAVDYLVQRVWPKVRPRVPEAKLAIIGNGAELTKSYPPRDSSVSFLGFVEDLEEWYARARVVCCPIFHGSGTRVKIIEAAAHAKAIVSTHLGAEGLNFADGTEILLRDSPQGLADACVALLSNANAAAHFGHAARKHAAAHYERSAVVERLAKIFSAACNP